MENSQGGLILILVSQGHPTLKDIFTYNLGMVSVYLQRQLQHARHRMVSTQWSLWPPQVREGSVAQDGEGWRLNPEARISDPGAMIEVCSCRVALHPTCRVHPGCKLRLKLALYVVRAAAGQALTD